MHDLRGRPFSYPCFRYIGKVKTFGLERIVFAFCWTLWDSKISIPDRHIGRNILCGVALCNIWKSLHVRYTVEKNTFMLHFCGKIHINS